MSTEILGFFIILGALVLVVLRKNDWMKLLGGEGHSGHIGDAEEASAKLRYELQHSADEIISRMGDHIDHLERLVAEADRRSAELEEQLRRLKEAEAKLPKPSETTPEPYVMGALHPAMNSREMQQSPAPVFETVSEPQEPFADMLEASMTDDTMDYEQRAYATRPDYDVDPEVVVSPSVADVVGLPLTPEEAEMMETAVMEREDISEDFNMLPDSEESVGEEQRAEQEAAERQAVEEALQLHGGGVSEQVRSLLAQGKSVDEIARQVQMGRGAIELIRQMEKNKDTI